MNSEDVYHPHTQDISQAFLKLKSFRFCYCNSKEKSNKYILQSISFSVPQKKERKKEMRVFQIFGELLYYTSLNKTLY